MYQQRAVAAGGEHEGNHQGVRQEVVVILVAIRGDDNLGVVQFRRHLHPCAWLGLGNVHELHDEASVGKARSACRDEAYAGMHRLVYPFGIARRYREGLDVDFQHQPLPLGGGERTETGLKSLPGGKAVSDRHREGVLCHNVQLFHLLFLLY